MAHTLLASTGGLEVMNTYGFIILLCLVIILSYGFNLLASKTRIPSVLMLIGLGVGLQFMADAAHFKPPNLSFALDVLGQVGLIMIVLEAALELEIRKEKLPLIGKAFGTATVGLILCVAGIAVIIYYMGNLGYEGEGMSWLTAILDATCLAVISSAIVIPSVGVLSGKRKEWMIYEATFSDILGIMLFYFLLTLETNSVQKAGFEFAGSFVLTLLGSVAVSFLLVVVFQRIRTHIKLFLLIAVLMLLYFTGKVFHLSPLWVILIFGLVLANSRLFFRGFLDRYVDHEKVEEIDRDFTVLTLEFAFLVRTFFFVVFGFTLDLPSLLSPHAWIEAVAITALIFLVRFISLRMFRWKDILSPELWIAPRGLITILLFFSIPANLVAPEELFRSGILLIVILLTSGIMTWGMVRHKEEHPAGGPEGLEMEGILPLERVRKHAPIPENPWVPEALVESADGTDGSTLSEPGAAAPPGEHPLHARPPLADAGTASAKGASVEDGRDPDRDADRDAEAEDQDDASSQRPEEPGAAQKS